MEEFRPGTIAAPADAIKPAPTRGERERVRGERERGWSCCPRCRLPPPSSPAQRRRRRCLRVSLLGRCSLVREDRPRRKERKEGEREREKEKTRYPHSMYSFPSPCWGLAPIQLYLYLRWADFRMNALSIMTNISTVLVLV